MQTDIRDTKGAIKSGGQSEVFTCFEHQRLVRDSFIEPADFDYLLMQQLPCFDIRFFAGEPQLIARHYLATLWLPSGQRLEILPKITPQHTTGMDQLAISETRHWVAQMLSQIAGRVNLHPLAAASQAGERHNEQWFDIQQPWYLQLYQRLLEQIIAVSQFLPHHYQQQTQNSPQASGKINFKQQIKHNLHRPHYFVTQKDQWQEYTLLWQFLLTAEQQAQQILGISHADRLQINSKVSQFQRLNSSTYQQISQVLATLPQPQWQATYDSLQRNQQQWLSQCSPQQQALLLETIEWAWWFLQPIAMQPQLSFRETGLPCQAFMLNMQHAFEQWVSVSIAKQIHTDQALIGKQFELSIQPSYQWLCAPESAQVFNRHIQPDICVSQRVASQNSAAYAQRGISHVMDIKYKYLSRVASIDSNDLYQLQAYQRHLQAAHAWLIYPANENFNQPIRLQTVDKYHPHTAASQQSIVIVPFCTANARLLLDATMFDFA